MAETNKKDARIRPDTQVLALLILFYVYTVSLLPAQGADLLFWAKWASAILEHGLVSIYDTYIPSGKQQATGFMYGPVYMYLAYLFAKWQGSAYNIYLNIHQIKALYLVFDLIGIGYAVRFVREPNERPFFVLWLVFNGSLLYNTVEWGQVDGVLACFIVASLYYALRGRLVGSGILFTLTLFVKPQPIIFLPLFGLLWLAICLQKPLRYALKSSLLILVGVVIVLAPFVLAGTLGDYIAMLLDIDDAYPVVTINAANVWTLLLHGNTDTIPDNLVRFGLDYRQWGLLFFSIGYLVILVPLLRQLYQIQRGRREQISTSTALLVGGLVPIIFYFFNTRMHERYAHFSVLLLGAYALSSKDFGPYVVISVANFWIMNHFLKAFAIGSLDAIPLEYIALVFLLGLSWGVVQLYKRIFLHQYKPGTYSSTGR